MRTSLVFAVGACLAAWSQVACAQQKPVDQQIREAVSPLPEAMRAGATVLGYRRAGALTTIRQGTNQMICLADNPEQDGFQAACYHRALEPFMVRGRELRSQGITDLNDVNAVRLKEIESGALSMPDHPAALFSRTGESADSAGRLHVIYLPYATEETTGISSQPSRDRPWLMFPGAPWAHVMISLP